MKMEGISRLAVVTTFSIAGLAGCSELQTNASGSKAAVAQQSTQSNAIPHKQASATNVNSNSPQQNELKMMTPRQAQAKLNELGFKVGKVDGVIGPRTRAALRRFQKDRGIPVSGELDVATIAELSK